MKLSFAAVASLLVLWAGLRAAAQHSAAPEATKAVAVLSPTEGNNVRGVVTFTQAGANVRVVAQIEGLTPGKHGFHIHEWGDCSSKDGSSAGGHFNPGNKQHGTKNPQGSHAGDMPNFTVAADGTAKTTVTNSAVTMGSEANSIFASGGTALVIHAKPDDMMTDPSGNAGDSSRTQPQLTGRCNSLASLLAIPRPRPPPRGTLPAAPSATRGGRIPGP